MRPLLAVVVALGCDGSGAHDIDAGADASPPDAPGPTRPTALASTGAQLLLTPAPGIYLTPANLATDVDVPVIHQEFYGVPWTAFENGTAPPPEWVAVMDQLAADASAIGPVWLSLQLVSGDRTHLAPETVISQGRITTQDDPATQCFDFATAQGATKRAAYVAYVDWMVRKFKPRYVNVAIELNIFAHGCPAQWDAMVDTERAAYDAAKAAQPDAAVFPSIQLEFLYGYANCPGGDLTACYDAAYAKLANLKRDRFAVTSMPFLVAALRDINAMPADYLTRAGDRGGEATVIAETGWLGTPLVARLNTQCITAIPSSEGDQLAYFDRVLAAAAAHEIEVVTWVSNRDVLPAELMTDCPCDYDATWCGFLDAYRQAVGGTDANAQASAEYGLKQFGSMGLRLHDGTPRSQLFSLWQDARSLPWRGPR